FRAELAALEQGGGSQVAAAMQAQRNEMARLLRYYRSIGCERGPLGFLSGPRPAECGPIAGQIRQLEAGYNRLAAQAQSGDIALRRRQLQAAVEQTRSAGPRGFFESLFGPPRGQPRPHEIMPEGQPIIADGRPTGGRQLICVKTCDGSYFPLSAVP